jgi:glycine cleavage system transcriptional repressor
MSDDRNFKVLTAVGHDRPGLVSGISELIHSSGANLEDSRMAILGGEFALVLLFSGTADAVTKVVEGAQTMGDRLGLEIGVKDTKHARGARDILRYRLRVTGLDHPGIVHTITGALSQREVNVASLQSRVVHLPLSGTPNFELEVEVEVPPSLSIPELEETIRAVCARENLEFNFEPST